MAAKSQMREERIRSIEVRLHSQTPTEQVEEHLPSPEKFVPRSKSYSKTSRVNEGNPILQMIKSRILAHEPTVLGTFPLTPKKKPPDLTIRRHFLRRQTVECSPETGRLNRSVTPPKELREKNASFVAFERRPGFRPNAFLQSELIRAGLLKTTPDSKATPPRLRQGLQPESLTPTQRTNRLLEDSPGKRYGNEWEMRKRKEHLKQVLRNMKRLEVSKRNLWKNKPV